MNTTEFFSENSSKQNKSLQCSHSILPQNTKIEDKLNYFLVNNKIPNIIFNGSSGTGKKTIVYEFINKIYNYDKSKIKTNVLFVNCSHGKGIKFIREELKFFAKTNIQSNSGVLFKTIVLMNADYLTIDAQSALRRCIELFSYNTRFFIIVENKNKLLNPILSRFCEIYVPEYSTPLCESNDGLSNYKVLNLHQHHLNNSIDLTENNHEKMEFIREHLHHLSFNTPIMGINLSDKSSNLSTSLMRKDISPFHNGNMENIHCSLLDVCNIFYENGICGLDILHFVENAGLWNEKDIINYNVTFYNIKSEYRCEKLLMFYILDLIFVSK
jgi:hypothetical protein